MKRSLLPLILLVATIQMNAQVTQINSNKSLSFEYPLGNNKSLFVSDLDETLWVTDGTLAGTIQLSAGIKHEGDIGSTGFLNGSYIFAGNTPAQGTELFITDGTPAGTVLLKEIIPGPTGSLPDDGGIVLNGFLYFTAISLNEGRELWKTNGTTAGTTLVKDIVTGPTGSNTAGNYNMAVTATHVFFAAQTASSGIELWRSDGTNAGTAMLKDLNSGAPSSNPRAFYPLNNLLLFVATTADFGEEVWRTDGTVAGTIQLADINPGPASSTTLTIAPGVDFPILLSFHTFNNSAYFNVFNGTSTGVLWGTDGTTANTDPVKDIVPGTSLSFVSVISAVNLANKFIFPVADGIGRSELWESDGTPAGTKLFKAFTPPSPGIPPTIFVPFAFTGGVFSQPLFQGNKFFFMAGTAAEGNELWISDGVDATVTHTHIVKDIYAGANDGLDPAIISYIYTPTAFFFPAVTAANGSELFRTDGTTAGTNIVADIITGTGGSEPELSPFIVNGKIVFSATNGDNVATDLYAVDGTFVPLPVTLTAFTGVLQPTGALLQWSTSQEQNSKDFTIQKSYNGVNFEDIGSVAAAGNSFAQRNYSFIDGAIHNSGMNLVYYRLKQTDIDGRSTLSQVITLKLKSGANWKVQLLANPIADQVRLLLTGVKENIQLSILDMNGKKLHSRTSSAINGLVSLPSNNLPRGAYILVVVSGNETQTLQFVK